MIRKIFAATALVVTMSSCDVLSTVQANLPITEAEAAQGIRQALDKGVNEGVSYLNRTDGFFGNAAYKLLMPPEAQRIENTLRTIGMGSLVDRAILSINRAAEDAVGEAKPIFADAIRQMTIADAINIVKGADNAATEYFRQRTSQALVNAFTPVVKTSLDKVNATKYYGDVINAYNALPTTINKVNPDLANYVVNRAVTALFDQVAKEEANIRANPVARTTELLKKVFGWAARNRGF